MVFLGLGLLLAALKFLEISQVASWPWWVVLSPFGLAAAWWTWADWSGYTKRKVVEKENARRDQRVAKHREKLGLPPQRSKR